MASTMAGGLLLSISATGVIEELAGGMIDAEGIADLGDGNVLALGSYRPVILLANR